MEDVSTAILSRAKIKGIEPNPEGYYSICHTCTDIRKRISKTLKRKSLDSNFSED